MPRCAECGESKPPEEFPRNRSHLSGRHPYCKSCNNARGRETVRRLHGGSRHYHLTGRYGIGADDVATMIDEQGGICPICRGREPTHVDHDHTTGKVRAILCGPCNTGSGSSRMTPFASVLQSITSRSMRKSLHESPMPPMRASQAGQRLRRSRATKSGYPRPLQAVPSRCRRESRSASITGPRSQRQRTAPVRDRQRGGGLDGASAGRVWDLSDAQGDPCGPRSSDGAGEGRTVLQLQ